jgi:hypothetical protein
MDVFDAADLIKQSWLASAATIPSEKIVMATCPFCGKGDRIRIVPDDEPAGGDETDGYRAAYALLAGPDRRPGICGFCLNVVVMTCGKAHLPGEE